MPSALLPEIRESDASPQIHAIYDDICNVMRVPFVNLIHRYLATIPGALEYAWSLGRDAFLDGRLDGWVATMVANAGLEEIAATPGRMLPESDRESAGRIVEIYNRQNPRNVIVFSALLTILRSRELRPSSDAPPTFTAAQRTIPSTVMPSLPKFDQLDERTRHLLQELARMQKLEGTGLVPSLYLHLATIPGAVAATYDAIAAPLHDGVIAERVGRIRTGAMAVASELVPGAPAVPASVYLRRAEIAGVIASFTERAIPSMVVIGNVLARRFA